MPDFAALGAGVMFALIAFVVILIIAQWKIYTKAGQPGWGCLVPIYNLYLLCKMGDKPGWWLILCMIPYVGFIFSIIVWAGVCKNFGKGTGFLLGLIFLSPIFMLILGFGSAEYQGARPGTPPAAPVA